MSKNNGYMGFIVLFSALITGCSGDLSNKESAEQEHVLMKQAAAFERNGKIDEAINCYKQVLVQAPQNARAHLDAGILYQDRKQDYVKALYHYAVYLELRPDAEKSELVTNRIRDAEQAFVSKTLNILKIEDNSSAAVERENITLKEQLAKANRQLSEYSAKIKEITKKQDKSTAESQSALSATRTYTVNYGDSLTSIAQKIYGEGSKWIAIYEANKSALQQSHTLRVGQILIIP